jgi:hypothetical protein
MGREGTVVGGEGRGGVTLLLVVGAMREEVVLGREGSEVVARREGRAGVLLLVVVVVMRMVVTAREGDRSGVRGLNE